MDAVCKKFDELLTAITDQEDQIGKEIASLLEKKDWQGINEKTEYVSAIQRFAEQMKKSQAEWLDLVGGNNDATEKTNSSASSKETVPVEDRTSWEIIDGEKIRVVTQAGKKEYSNVIPISLFKELAETALKEINRKGHVRTSDVLQLDAEKISEVSEYKKSPNLPVYVTFKILVKEGIFAKDESNSRRYRLAAGDQGIALQTFLKNLEKRS